MHDRNFLGVISIGGIYICFYMPKKKKKKNGGVRNVEVTGVLVGQHRHFPPPGMRDVAWEGCPGQALSIPALLPAAAEMHPQRSLGKIFLQTPRERALRSQKRFHRWGHGALLLHGENPFPSRGIIKGFALGNK